MPVLAAQQMIEGSLAQVSDLAALAKAAHVSERTLSRRFAAATGHSVRGYVAECRLELARLMLRGTTDPLTLIADECGFGSVSALVRAFGARHDKGARCAIGNGRRDVRWSANARCSVAHSTVPRHPATNATVTT